MYLKIQVALIKNPSVISRYVVLKC